MTHLFQCTITDDMASIAQHSEAESAVELLPSDRADKLGFVTGLKVALCGDA